MPGGPVGPCRCELLKSLLPQPNSLDNGGQPPHHGGMTTRTGLDDAKDALMRIQGRRLQAVGSAPLAPLREFFMAKRSAATRRAYKGDLEAFMRFMRRGGESMFAATPGDVAAWRDAQTAQGLAPATVARRISAVRAAFRFLVATGRLSQNPADPVEAPRVDAHRASAPWLERAEARRLLNAPDPSTRRGLRDRAILALLLGLGLRRGELAALRCGDIQATPGGGYTLRVQGKRGKVRVLTMNGAFAPVAAYLQAEGRELSDEGLLFKGLLGRELSGEAVRKIVARYALQADVAVQGGESISPHGLRRSFATRALDGGASIEMLRRAMGHSSVATTSRYDKRADADLTVSY